MLPCHFLKELGAVCAGVTGDLVMGLFFLQLSATHSRPASYAPLHVPMNYTWAPLRHLTAGFSGTYQQQLQPGCPFVTAY